nr:leukocyte receptor cluster member 9 isoform X2 [Doryrhamphus excisus]
MASITTAEGPVDLGTTKTVVLTDEEAPNVCPFFLMGKCHFGPRCRMSHRGSQLIHEETSSSVEPSVATSRAVLVEDRAAEPEEEKQKKKKGNRNKAAKSKEKEAKDDISKKPRMRTADDIISRIVWDPSVDASQFLVGYVDRFLGVLERPFSEFNWDADPCDCDYTTELALPRHRIQYFTYKGHRIWDRHSRTDRVFGSTGQSLAPPFGGEEEVEGKETPAEGREERGQATREEPPAVNGQGMDRTTTDSAHLEDNTHTSDSAQASLGRPCVAEEAANSLTASAVKEERLVQEERTAEGEEGFESQDTSTPSVPLGQGSENHGGRPPKKKPTHFITFRANTPAILSCFQQLQEEITALLPSSAPHWQTSSSLHVTLCLLVLAGPAEVAAAEEILREFVRLDRNPPVAVAFPVKLKHFNGRVMYLSPQPQLRLQQLNSGLQEAYRRRGWLHRDSYNPRYHLTLAKVKDKDGERIFSDVGDMKVGKGFNFGRLPVNTLHLCVMGGPGVDGFYETVCTVTLR